MSRTERGTSTGWRAWCRRNTPDTVRERREADGVRIDATQVPLELEGLEMDARLPDVCDGRGCTFCSEDWRAEPLPPGVFTDAHPGHPPHDDKFAAWADEPDLELAEPAGEWWLEPDVGVPWFELGGEGGQ